MKGGLQPKLVAELGDLPEGWTEVCLADLVTEKIGGEWGLADEGPERPGWTRVKVLRGTEFRDWEKDKGRTAAVRRVKEASLAKRQLAEGDLVVEVSGGGVGQSVGRTLLIDGEALERAEGPLLCSNFCRRLRLHPELCPAYVQLGLQHLYLTGGLDAFQTQTTNLRNLSFQAFLTGVILPLPPPSEQGRIAAQAGDLLVRVRGARERISRLPLLLRRWRRSILDAATIGNLTGDLHLEGGGSPLEAGAEPAVPSPLDLPLLPASWSWVPLREVALRAQLGTSLKADAEPGRGVPVLRMGNVRGGRVDLSDLKGIARRLEELSGFKLERGDLLFNRTNSPELVGKAAVFEADLDAVFASYLIRVVCDPARVDSRFVSFWINSSWGRAWARAVRTDSASQSNINTAKLLSLPVPLPPLAEQREIVRRAHALLAVADKIEARVAVAARRSEEIVQALLARALAGDLVETEAELAARNGMGFESAAEWLARTERNRGTRLDPVASRRPPRTLARDQRYALPSPDRENVASYSQEWVLAVFRKVCWGAAPMSREELLRRVGRRLGVPLTWANRRGLLEHFDVACARQIVGLEQGRFSGATPTFGRYEYDFLAHTLRAVMDPNILYPREDVVRRVAAHLGYSQVTPAIGQRMEGFFHYALHSGLLLERRGRLWRRG